MTGVQTCALPILVLIITELKARKPELPYFDDSYNGEYPDEAPFTISELEEIYPAASAISKENLAYKEEAMEARSEERRVGKECVSTCRLCALLRL